METPHFPHREYIALWLYQLLDQGVQIVLKMVANSRQAQVRHWLPTLVHRNVYLHQYLWWEFPLQL